MPNTKEKKSTTKTKRKEKPKSHSVIIRLAHPTARLLEVSPNRDYGGFLLIEKDAYRVSISTLEDLLKRQWVTLHTLDGGILVYTITPEGREQAKFLEGLRREYQQEILWGEETYQALAAVTASQVRDTGQEMLWEEEMYQCLINQKNKEGGGVPS